MANISIARLRRGANFAGARALLSKFGAAAASNAVFDSISASNAQFDAAVLWQASFRAAVLTNARFAFSVMPQADLSGASVSRADFDFADLAGSKWSNVTGWDFVNWIGADATGIRDAPKGLRETALKHGAIELPGRGADSGLVAIVKRRFTCGVTNMVMPVTNPGTLAVDTRPPGCYHFGNNPPAVLTGRPLTRKRARHHPEASARVQ